MRLLIMILPWRGLSKTGGKLPLPISLKEAVGDGIGSGWFYRCLVNILQNDLEIA